MSDPQSPNYKKDVGRLATDRYDSEDHIEGNKFKHNANQIIVSPPLVLGGTFTDVQSAIDALAVAAQPPVIQDATTSHKGIVQLAGDIGGFATNVVVQRIQGLPISTITPHAGDVLTWDGYSNIWNPSPAINAFSAAGDLSGNNILQNVVGLTGTSGTVRASCNVISFVLSSTPVISQDVTSIANGKDFTISAQTATGSGKNGGTLILTGGNKGFGALRGGATIQLTSTDGPMLEVAEIATNRRVLSLLRDAPITSTEMPSNTGDLVMYIHDAAVVPSSGNPVNGVIVYSSGGQLWVKQPDGNNFSVGSIPNPSIWGSSGQEVYTQRIYVSTTGSTPNTALVFPLPDNTATRADVIIIGKKNGSADSAQFNLSMGYVRDGGGTPVSVGTLTNADSRTTAGASTWTLPTINISGNNLQVLTGADTGSTINWFLVVQLSMSQG